jgi:hypothetical protein
VSFKRNNRMPAFIWGGYTDNFVGSWIQALGLPSHRFTANVPISERLARVTFPSSTTPRTQSDSPCDSQLPWMQFEVFEPEFVGPSPIVAGVRLLGLTLFGEVYYVVGTLLTGTVSNNAFSRKIIPAKMSVIGKPVKKLASAYALATDAKLWRLRDFVVDPQECTIPGGDDIVDIMPFGPAVIAVGESGDMYWNRNSSNAATTTSFNKCTKWVSSLTIENPGNYPFVPGTETRTLEFSAPEGVGKKAEGYAIITNTKVTEVGITYSGWGYEETPTVTIPGSAVISASLFDAVPLKHARRAVLSSSNTVMQFVEHGFYERPEYGNDWKILVGSQGGVGIKTSGELWAYGYRWYGNSSFTPSKIANGSWIAVGATAISAAAIRDDFTLWTWGLNFNGSLGDSTDPESRREAPVQINPGTEWVDIFGFGSTFDGNFIAIRKDSQRRQYDQAFEFWPDSYFAGT